MRRHGSLLPEIQIALLIVIHSLCRFLSSASTSPNIAADYCTKCSVALYLLDVYDALNGASALAANGLLRYVLGAAFPLFTVQSKLAGPSLTLVNINHLSRLRWTSDSKLTML